MRAPLLGLAKSIYYFKDKSLVGSSFHTIRSHSCFRNAFVTRLVSRDKEFRTWSSDQVVWNTELKTYFLVLDIRMLFTFMSKVSHDDTLVSRCKEFSCFRFLLFFCFVFLDCRRLQVKPLN